MATTVVKRIQATGGDYTTPVAWEAAIPADLTAIDEHWRGEMADEVFTGTFTILTIDGHVVDATRYIELTSRANSGFHPFLKGSGPVIRATSGGGSHRNILVQDPYVRIHGFELDGGGLSSQNGIIFGDCGGTTGDLRVDHMLVNCNIGTGSTNRPPFVLTNIIGFEYPASGAAITGAGPTVLDEARFCSFVRTSPDAAISAHGIGGVKANNIACFHWGGSGGFYNFNPVSMSAGSSNNASDDDVGGGGDINGLVAADEFTSIGSPWNLRPKTGNNLQGAGITISGQTTDVTGVTRASPPAIGAAEEYNPASYELRTDGLAADLTYCIMVDSDGLTIRDFKSALVTADMAVAAEVGRGLSSWKGEDRSFFSTKANGSFNFFGITFGTNKPPLDLSDGVGFFAATAGARPGSGTQSSCINGSLGVNRRASDGFLVLHQSAGDRHVGTTVLPIDDTTKYSIAANYQASVSARVFYGLESGSLSANSTAANPGGFGSNGGTVTVLGGVNGSGHWASRWHIVCGFNRPLTESEYQSLHNDYFSELFETAAGGTPQILVPTVDITDGDWEASNGGSDLAAMLDETTFNDADYIYTRVLGVCEIRLQPAADPASSSGHIVRYRARGNGSTDLIVRLKQGSTTIASWTETNVPASETDYQHTLSGAEADAITDYSDLRLQFEAA